ncbi:MAG TPA: alpha/beta fold hydrolase [Rhodoferax sp.]|jgi:predicted alpha/beta hydrolase|nr:alpha/beta fold hydrolase [Rhodoferax sp.]HNV60109.1 alpha/beta fold hydrolase [Rhodoferax sp.]HPW29627.1 alpha/beta fold hydrolase [Rhodoferax sp.]
MTKPQTLTITASDQHRFNATLYPTSDSNAPVLIFMSALGTPAKVYRHLGNEMVQHGVQVCTPDWRGIDSSSVRACRTSDFGYRHLLEIDIPALIATVRQKLPDAPIWLGGHSLGGQMALTSAAGNPGPVSGVILIASGSVHLPCYQGKLRWGVRLLASLSSIAGPVLGYFPGRRIGFGGREAAGLMHDWSHVAWTGEYRPAGSQLDYERLFQALDLPVLAITFDADKWAPAAATHALLSKVSKRKPIHRHLSAAETQGIAVDHYSWIKKPSFIAPAVAKFIRKSG